MIDDTDRDIIKHLQTDGRMPYSHLAQLVGLSDAATRQRVNRLTERGVIDIVAVTDPGLLGLGYQALLGIKVDGDIVPVVQEISIHQDAVYVVVTAGRFDVVVEVVCRSTTAFIELTNNIRSIGGVNDIETLTYLQLVKQTYDWGVGSASVSPE